MNFNISKFRALAVPLLLLFITSCQEDFLEKKPDKSLVVPSSLPDFQALLDNSGLVMNWEPALGYLGADEYYLTDEAWLSLYTSAERNSYIWAKDIFEAEGSGDWNKSYEQVFYANVVLDGLKDVAITDENEEEWQYLQSSALFYRANAFYSLVKYFAQPYSDATAATPGIPLRLSSDVNAQVPRASLKESYEQIISDLTSALPGLPKQIQFKSRPYKPTVYALLARVYLSMGNYAAAGSYADSCLTTNSYLMDYNELDTTLRRPVPFLNDEVIFQSYVNAQSTSSKALMDSTLYHSYDSNDLRKSVFFNFNKDGTIAFDGTYTGGISLFGGTATDEMYLIRAECNARQGKNDLALEDLNTLLEKRWKTGTFVPIDADDPNDVLKIILEERKKELVFRSLRWEDLRRLNREDAFARVLTRELNGERYVLPPGDARYTYPIPENEIQLSGIVQNPR